MRIEIPCPICNERFEYELEDSMLPESSMMPVIVTHKDHALMVYIDKFGNVIGVDDTIVDPRFFSI
ncbi:MAG: hypothetical protein QXL15_01135 [Candidatus Korarchaeota archaeon]